MKFNQFYRIIKIPLLILLVVGYFVFVSEIWRFYQADLKATSSIERIEAADCSNAIVFADEAISLNPHEPYYHRTRARAKLIEALMSSSYDENKKNALDDLQRSVELNPLNLATLRNNISLYYYLALKDLEVSGDSKSVVVDSDYLPITISYYESLKDNYSNDVGILVSLAHYEGKLGLEEERNFTLDQIKTLRPELLEWHPLLN